MLSFDLSTPIGAALVLAFLMVVFASYGSRWSGTPLDRVTAFADVLRAAGVTVTVRDTRGREIVAACGQLRLLKAE